MNIGFLELTYDDGDSVLVNIDNIRYICTYKGRAIIEFVGDGDPLQVLETYDEVHQRLKKALKGEST